MTTTKTSTKSRKRSWSEFRPEWANEQIERISAELEKWNDELQARSERFRRQSQKRIETAVQQLQDELRKLPGMKRAEEIRQDLGKRVDEGVDSLYAHLHIARLEEVKRLERKIGQLNRKLRELEKQVAA